MRISHQGREYRLCSDEAQNETVLQLLDYITKENATELSRFLRKHSDNAAQLVTEPLKFVRRVENVQDTDSSATAFKCIHHAVYELRAEMEMRKDPSEVARRSVFDALEKEAQSMDVEIGYRPGSSHP